MTAPPLIVELVDKFDRNIESYRSGKYNEAQIRQEFINPLFIALGWDVYNERGYAEAYKDVIVEDSVRVEGSAKAPDYSFRIGGNRKFFVEAKKPSVNLKDDISPAFQLRRYSWSAKLPLGILTDFEELAVYDGRVQPVKSDKASKARVKYFTYGEYVDRWDEIAAIFSREEVLRGSFDRYVESTRAKRGTAEVDAAFLREIEAWRDLLARNIALRNPDLSTRELNFAVQRTIDRIVFLRICEDRGIEKYGWLQSLLEGQRVYPRLCEFFRRADERYNSGLFHFSNDPARQEPPDELTLALVIDDKVLKDIIRDLYYPDSPYEFSVLPPEILGQVYEQFLGKVISLTPGHRAKVEYKPEVRKAGGVYYTPSYIVSYIVDETIGKLLAGLTPAAASDLRILDPACGSGSFLIGAYQRLLDWHRDWYVEKLVPLLEAGLTPSSKEVLALLPEGQGRGGFGSGTGNCGRGGSAAPKAGRGRGRKKGSNSSSNGNHFPIFQAQGGEWKLTTEERKRILLNNIYGVDIDPSAVEVTKLSLHLKVLEGESEETLSKQLKLFQERALPDLGENIKCGNSLIGWDILEERHDLTEEEIERINPFDWDGEFPEIMSRGGFDAVIGNPPYVRHHFLGDVKDYFKRRYRLYNGISDIYVCFIEIGLLLLKNGGVLSYIVANKWLRAAYGEPLRQGLKEQNIEEIIDFGDLPVFQKATTYPCILRVSKRNPRSTFTVARVNTLQFPNLADYVKTHNYNVNINSLDDSGWSLADEHTWLMLKKMHCVSAPLSQYVDENAYLGILTGLDRVFIIDTKTRDKLVMEDPKSEQLLKPFVMGKDVKRYMSPLSGRYLVMIPSGWTRNQSANAPDAWAWFKKNYPAIANYLSIFADAIASRCDANKGEYWWELRSCNYYEEFEKQKIMYDVFQIKPSFTFDKIGSYANHAVWIIPKQDMYLLGILNSKLGWVMISNYCTQIKNGYQLMFKYLRNIPIRTIDFSDPQDVARHDQMVGLVERMLDLHKRLAETKAGHEKTLLQRQIEATDKQIDRLVYELYGLTEDEIKIVEEAAAG